MAATLTQGLLAAAGAAASAAYLDAKFHISKDRNAIKNMATAEARTLQAIKDKKMSLFFLFEASALKQPNEVCIWSRQGIYTWIETYHKVCQYGHYFQKLGVQPGDTVALYMYNRPEFLFAWFGLFTIGAAPALINYNLASDALAHCLGIAKSKFVLYDNAPDCVERIHAAEKQLQQLGIQLIALDDAFHKSIASYPTARPHTNAFENCATLPMCVLYTSGTTGLPKGARIPMTRQYLLSSVPTRAFQQKHGPSGDRSYVCVPLYHGTGGFGATGDLTYGMSVALAPKFSLSNFWKDCIDSQATIFIYVGELIRYLLSAPPAETDRQHKVRMVWGNGLSPELWTPFKERFGVQEIGEFFGSTEGVFGLSNFSRGGFNHGAVGHHGVLLRRHYHNIFIPVFIDPDTGDVWRDPKTGFARRVPYEQGGEIICKLESKGDWHGYVTKEATDKKFMVDVFVKGDLYYRTGDALRRTSDGLWYFMDRLGDTYRWKGENVSTSEVTQIIGAVPEIAEANVYGVKLPAHDGRAGCAAISFKDPSAIDRFSWAGLVTRLRAELPHYAVPVFIRVRGVVGGMSTDNHKNSKVPLREEGVDPKAMGTKVKGGKEDKVFWLPASGSSYVPFTAKDWKMVSQARARI